MVVRKYFYSIVLVAVVITTGYSQTDTLRIFQYNLLNYGDNVNPTAYKDVRLKTILDYANPDVFCANEIYSTASLQTNILTSVLDTGWDKGTYVNTNNQVQTNMLFWKKSKLGLVSQTTISHLLRDIIAFKFYYKGFVMSTTDTVFLTVIIAHLKASSDTNSAKLRNQEVQTAINYLDGLNKGGNYIFMGDFNIYESTEAAYLSMTNHASVHARLYDPINRYGIWHNNNNYADIHTQSTRSANISDGGVSGGMDDRFDFILTSDHLLNDSSGIKYITGSYKTLGQDGQHFNKSINAMPTNSSAPANVIQALYDMSDHLPVYADFVVMPKNLSIVPSKILNYQFAKVVNPFTNNKLTMIWDKGVLSKESVIQLYSTDGRVLYNSKHVIARIKEDISIIDNLPNGLYLLKVRVGQHLILNKLVKR